MFYCRLVGLGGGLRRAERLGVGIKLTLRNGVSLCFGNVALYIGISVGHLRLRLGQLSFGLVKSGLEWTRIDLEQELTSSDEAPFTIILANQITAHLWLNLCIDVAFERSHPLAPKRHVFLNNRCDFDHQWRSRSGGSHLTVATQRTHQ